MGAYWGLDRGGSGSYSCLADLEVPPTSPRPCAPLLLYWASWGCRFISVWSWPGPSWAASSQLSQEGAGRGLVGSSPFPDLPCAAGRAMGPCRGSQVVGVQYAMLDPSALPPAPGRGAAWGGPVAPQQGAGPGWEPTPRQCGSLLVPCLGAGAAGAPSPGTMQTRLDKVPSCSERRTIPGWGLPMPLAITPGLWLQPCTQCTSLRARSPAPLTCPPPSPHPSVQQ